MPAKESSNNSNRPDGTQKLSGPGNLQTNSHKTSSASGGEKPEPRPKLTLEEARANYHKWLERLESRASEDPAVKKLLDPTRDLVAHLAEPNILAVYRLVEIFGISLVQEKVDQALALHNKAVAQGETAYRPRESSRAVKPEHRFVGTEVATAKGQPRSPGGVFFFLIRGHVSRLRLAWEDLRIPWLPEQEQEANQTTAQSGKGTRGQTQTAQPQGVGFLNVEGTAPVDTSSKKDSLEKKDVGGQVGEGISDIKGKFGGVTAPSSTLKTPATPAGNISANSNGGNSPGGLEAGGGAVVKPSRGKVVITGRLRAGSQPKAAPQGLAGVLELLFEIEPGANPPKGLPVLEKTLVKVWATEKQYNKIKDSLTAASRYLVEGEIGAGINSQNFQPFIRVICTRLTTLELEQENKLKKAE